MKVLLAHNHYGSTAPSGENQVFEAERALLRARGHDVATFERHSDELRRAGVAGAVRGALATPWNPWSAAAVKAEVASFAPDVVHAHNVFPLLSPSIFSAISTCAARVLTLHNYRLFCPAAIPMRNGRVCTECLDRRSPLPAVRHGCYRGSRLATAPLAVGIALHRALGTWRRHVDAFIVLSEFQRDRFIACGLPPERVHVKPNFFPGSPAPIPWGDRAAGVVFAGRLTPEKGLLTLLRAWMLLGDGAPPLLIAGDGPDRSAAERLARAAPSGKVRFLGQLASGDAVAQIARARLVVVPSEAFEGFPMVIREAFAHGTPVAASRIGPLPSIVRDGVNGVLFEAGSPDSLAAAIRRAWSDPPMLERLGAGARSAFEQAYTEDANYAALMRVYGAAIAVSRAHREIR